MISIDTASDAAPYEQIKQQIAAAVTGGDLSPGDKLPTVRKLAADLALAPNTVARAYRELETSGLLETRGRGGTFVKGTGVDRAAREAAWEYAERMRALGITSGDALSMVRKAMG